MEQETNQQPQVNLSLADLTLALQIIQVASNRNAFKPEEFEEVGGCYNRIFKFLETTGAIQRTDAQQQGDNEVVEPEAKEESVANAVAKPAAKKPAAKKATATKAAPKSKGKTK